MRRRRRIIMPWFWITAVFCVLCLSPQYGAHAQNNANTLQSQSGMKEGGTPEVGWPSQNVTGSSTGMLHSGSKSLDDLSLDDIPMMTESSNSTMCQGKYAVGEMFAPNCEERCRCVVGGRLLCEPRCQLPLVRRGVRSDPLCQEKPSSDECCVLLTCQQNDENGKSEEGQCTHKNETFKNGITWNDGCLSVCNCHSGVVECNARCPPTNATADKEGCVSLPDRNDPCCTVVLCDVNLAESEEGKIAGMEATMSEEIQLASADALNGTAAIVHFVGEPMLDVNLTAEYSEDGLTWHPAKVDGGIIAGLTPGRVHHLRVTSAGRTSNAVMVDLPLLDGMSIGRVMSSNTSADMSSPSFAASGEGLEYCSHKGQNYTLGQEFNDECISFCICTDTGVDCSPIECPSEFGLDVLDPTCLKWETRARDFSPKPPNCCSDHAKCLDNGSCRYMDQTYPNWAEIPSHITGCERKCYCELGNVTCQNVCEPVPPTPPSDLPCPAAMAQLQLLPGDSCCRLWTCPASHGDSGKSVARNDTKHANQGVAKPHHNFLSPFGLDENGEPTEPPLLGPFRLPPLPKHTTTTTSPQHTPDAANIPGPPYGLKHNLQDFLATKDEGIHGPPPFVVKPSKHDIDHKLAINNKLNKPGKVVVKGEGVDELSSLSGPFPLHPPLVGNVYVSEVQNKPFHAPDVYLPQHNIPAPGTPHQFPIYNFIPPQYHDDPRIVAKERLHTFNATALAGPEAAGGVVVQVLEPLDEHTVRLAFSVPPILVGLHGRVEVRYTPDKHEFDPASWERQVLAPPGDLIATPQLHFDLGNLLPDTTYSIFIKVILRGISNAVESPILSVKTLTITDTTTLPPQISIDPQLSAVQVNATWATIKWRKFTDFELQFIDGLQLRFREHDGKVFSATPLIHRSVTLYSLPDLKPDSSYEVGLFFIPFPGQTTELQSDKNINFVTAVETDPYRFDIELDIVAIKSTGVEVTWTGVPYPEDKYVNIYRVIYQSESGKEDFNSFKVAKRDSTPKITVLDLKPTTRYRLWLEAYLTNGRTKKSNVQDFVTKPGVQTAGVSSSGKLSGSVPLVESGDYYGPLVAVAVLAALAIMAALILVLVLMKKNSQNKAPITVRQTQSAYDNPSYKTSENDIPMNGNGLAHVEDGNHAAS